jgi:hypothetical protein
MPRSSKWSLSFSFSDRNFVCIYHFSHACSVYLIFRDLIIPIISGEEYVFSPDQTEANTNANYWRTAVRRPRRSRTRAHTKAKILRKTVSVTRQPLSRLLMDASQFEEWRVL